MRSLLGWLIFTAAGVWLQSMVQGVDFLAPGLLICLQQQALSWGLWLTLFWIVVQEGLGSLAFGSLVLWYAGLILTYVLLRSYFESENVVFILLISMFMGAWHFLLTTVMAGFQDLTISSDLLLRASLMQALFFPFVWFTARAMYRRYMVR
ncbi:MAG: hypothetical protein ACOC24_04780 [Desulfovibrionales bacterium]